MPHLKQSSDSLAAGPAWGCGNHNIKTTADKLGKRHPPFANHHNLSEVSPHSCCCFPRQNYIYFSRCPGALSSLPVHARISPTMSGIQTPGPLVLSHGDRASESLVEYESPSLCVCSSRPDPSSIVAVHGLNGERTTSWTNKSDDTFWLSDVLPGPDHIPSARIMTFGYISESIEVISAEGIRKAALELLKAVMALRNVAQEKVCYYNNFARN